jgi:methylated-DNA-[protein]-cysteine S-methyltransferase
MNVTPDLDTRFREAALREGLIDVRYDIVDSPVGNLFVAATERGLARISYWPEGMEETLARTFGPRVLRSPLDEVRRELDEYFDGTRTRFTVKLDWTLTGRGFRHEVLKHTNEIPYGRTSTYMEMATRSGNRKAYRAAGNALGSNPIPVVVPCHRVLATGGGLGGYGGGLDVKERLLHLEGAL